MFADALKYIQQSGLVLESKMGYTGKSDQCDNSLISSPNVKISGYNYCLGNCTESYVYSLLQSGPVLVGIDGENQNFRNYKSGIYSLPCNSMNHAVILVGYGFDDATKKNYWVIRNSWGMDWGENGYTRIERNVNNNNSCFVTYSAFSPILDSGFISSLDSSVTPPTASADSPPSK